MSAWKPYPKVMPPEGVPMRVELEDGKTCVGTFEEIDERHFDWILFGAPVGAYGDQVVRFKPIQADGGRRRRRLDLSTRAPRRGQLLRKI